MLSNAQVQEIPFTEWYKEQMIFYPGLAVADGDKIWKQEQRETPNLFVAYADDEGKMIVHKKMYRGRMNESGVEDAMSSSMVKKQKLAKGSDLEDCLAENENLFKKWRGDNPDTA